MCGFTSVGTFFFGQIFNKGQLKFTIKCSLFLLWIQYLKTNALIRRLVTLEGWFINISFNTDEEHLCLYVNEDMWRYFTEQIPSVYSLFNGKCVKKVRNEAHIAPSLTTLYEDHVVTASHLSPSTIQITQNWIRWAWMFTSGKPLFAHTEWLYCSVGGGTHRCYDTYRYSRAPRHTRWISPPLLSQINGATESTSNHL